MMGIIRYGYGYEEEIGDSLGRLVHARKYTLKSLFMDKGFFDRQIWGICDDVEECPNFKSLGLMGFARCGHEVKAGIEFMGEKLSELYLVAYRNTPDERLYNIFIDQKIPHLKSLKIVDHDLSHRTLMEISEENFPQLEYLALDYTFVSECELRHLMENCKQLLGFKIVRRHSPRRDCGLDWVSGFEACPATMKCIFVDDGSRCLDQEALLKQRLAEVVSPVVNLFFYPNFDLFEEEIRKYVSFCSDYK